MIVTRHAKQRIHEREGGGKAGAERRAQLALERGWRHGQTKGQLKKWLDGQWAYKETADEMRVYGDKLYVFAGDVLVTVRPIPRELVKDMEKRFIKREDTS